MFLSLGIQVNLVGILFKGPQGVLPNMLCAELAVALQFLPHV